MEGWCALRQGLVSLPGRRHLRGRFPRLRVRDCGVLETNEEGLDCGDRYTDHSVHVGFLPTSCRVLFVRIMILLPLVTGYSHSLI